MLKENIDANENMKPNSREMEKLKINFPQYFDKDGNFLLDRFQNMLKENETKFTKEGYELNFLGKSYGRLLSSTKTETFLAPLTSENEKEENKNSENLYIIGDNLDALKHLLGSYAGKIKCIYIDPPYNTGSDEFAYPDNFFYTAEKLADMLGIEEIEAERIINLKGKSSHSAWLTFMYPRLILARELLSDDGVIFISIDDNEQSNLKLICDEIFGEENFVADIIWNSTKSVTNTAIVSEAHTHNLVYFKIKDYFVKNRVEFRLKETGEGFSNPDNDPRGPWKADPFQVGGERPNQMYEIINPKTGVIYKPNIGNSWKNDYHRYLELISDNRIIFGVSGEAGPQRKRFKYEAEERGKVAKTIWDDIETTTNGTSTIKKLFDGNIIFPNPKPLSLLNRILQLSTNKDDIILDFFSGSATTAHAVMQLNSENFKNGGGYKSKIYFSSNT